MKLLFRDLNSSLCLPYPTSTYICKVTIAPRMRADNKYFIQTLKLQI